MEISDSLLDHLRHVAPIPDLAGTRYVLEDEIGRGGMGVVYAVHDCDLDRRVALKVIDSTFAGEAQLIARLEHPERLYRSMKRACCRMGAAFTR